MNKSLLLPAIVLLVAGTLSKDIAPSPSQQLVRRGILRSDDSSDEDRLWKHLMVERGYDVGVPPSTFDKETNTTRLVIDMQLELMGIMQVSEEDGTATFKAEFKQWWCDPRLSWNASNFGGVEYVWCLTGDNKEAWFPDTIIREDAGSKFFSDFKDTQIRVDYTGLHFWSTVGELKVAASMDFTKFPFDR